MLEKAEVFLRLKSASRPWPIASCSSTPGQPGPSTTSISPAGAVTRVKLNDRLARRLVGKMFGRLFRLEEFELYASAAA